MPYKSDKMKIDNPKLDRRVKLLPEDKAKIKILHAQGKAIREIARIFQVDKRLIQFILYPERLIQARKNRDWKLYYNKAKRAQAMREHRKYKHELLIAGKI